MQKICNIWTFSSFFGATIGTSNTVTYPSLPSFCQSIVFNNLAITFLFVLSMLISIES